ncbi:MAG: ATP-binding protein [Candidatus Gastranaerophilales bacterium]|nr:ATP-binding protein [Candidatus Gastranaerophilales bacterium]MCM1072785.1 ATP-binding protein [Bacteroides sp.]
MTIWSMLLDILQFSGNEYYTLLMLFILAIMGYLFYVVRGTKKRWNKLNDYLGDVTKTVNSIRYGDLSKKIKNIDIPDSEHLTESLNRMIETLHDRETMIVEYQNELAKQNKILEATINSLSDGLVIIDEHGKILRTTPLAAQWLGVEGKDLIGKLIAEYIETPKGKPISTLKNDEIVIINDKSSNFTASSVALKIEDKKNRHIVIIKNITDQKELESLKEDFVATLTHDLKVPIVAETNMIELFLNESFGEISEKQRLALKNMQTSNRDLLELVQTVLETYKIGKLKIYKENVMLKSFITEVIEEMSPIALKTGNKLKFIQDRDIRVLADRFQLKRVMKNLIQNAILYGEPKSPIEITIGEIPDYVVIKVKDHGAGISQRDIDKIFNKYYSAEKKFRKIGTGLGLYLSQQITKAHNGDLTVDSVEGEYTEFCVKIPVTKYEQSFI